MNAVIIFALIIIAIVFIYSAIINVAKEVTIQKLCKDRTVFEVKSILETYAAMEKARRI